MNDVLSTPLVLIPALPLAAFLVNGVYVFRFPRRAMRYQTNGV